MGQETTTKRGKETVGMDQGLVGRGRLFQQRAFSRSNRVLALLERSHTLMRHTWNNLGFVAVMVLSVIAGAALMTWAFQSDVFATRVDRIISTNASAVAAGRRINIDVKFVKSRECEGRFNQRRFLRRPVGWDGIHGVPIYVPLDSATLPVGSPTNGSVGEVIISYDRPRDIDPGDWDVVAKTERWCSALSFIFGPSVEELVGPTVPLPPVTNGQELSTGATGAGMEKPVNY